MVTHADTHAVGALEDEVGAGVGVARRPGILARATRLVPADAIQAQRVSPPPHSESALPGQALAVYGAGLRRRGDLIPAAVRVDSDVIWSGSTGCDSLPIKAGGRRWRSRSHGRSWMRRACVWRRRGARTWRHPAGCWHWRWCWTAATAPKRRGQAAWTGRRCATGCIGTTRPAWMACTTSRTRARRRASLPPSRKRRWRSGCGKAQAWSSTRWCAGG